MNSDSDGDASPLDSSGDAFDATMTLTTLRDAGTDLATLELEDLNTAYRDAQLSGKSDRRGLEGAIENGCGPHRIVELEEQVAGAETAVARAKETLIRLQSGEPELVRDWNAIIDCTMREVFDTLAMLADGLTKGAVDREALVLVCERGLWRVTGQAPEHKRLCDKQ